MSKFDVPIEDGSPLKWEYQEKIDVFHAWYWRTMKVPFFTWWIVTGSISAYLIFRWGRQSAIIDDAIRNGNHGVLTISAMLLMFVVPIFVCPCVSYVLTNKLHHSRFDESLKRRFGDNEDAKEVLEQIQKSLPF